MAAEVFGEIPMTKLLQWVNAPTWLVIAYAGSLFVLAHLIWWGPMYFNHRAMLASASSPYEKNMSYAQIRHSVAATLLLFTTLLLTIVMFFFVGYDRISFVTLLLCLCAYAHVTYLALYKTT